jgi:hypothetical protein
MRVYLTRQILGFIVPPDNAEAAMEKMQQCNKTTEGLPNKLMFELEGAYEL